MSGRIYVFLFSHLCVVIETPEGRTYHFLPLFFFSFLFQFLQDLFWSRRGQELHHLFPRFTTLNQKEKDTLSILILAGATDLCLPCSMSSWGVMDGPPIA